MRIKNHLANLVSQAIQNAHSAGALPVFPLPAIAIERPQKKEWGDFATALPLRLAREAKRGPLQIAQVIAAHWPPDPTVARVEAAAPGFVNIILSDTWLTQKVEVILAEGAQFGNAELERRERINVEYVSANPTGPMHVGSGRNAAIGDTLANVLQAAGQEVWREFYVNDAGSQILHFGASLFATYAQALGQDEKIPEDGYHGAYVVDMGKRLASEHGSEYLQIPREQAIRAVGRLGIDIVLAQLGETLARIGVRFDEWFSERSLHQGGTFAQVFDTLKEKGLIFERDGATWFAAKELGEQQDVVLIRSPQVIPDPDLRPTYLASDVAYLWSKLAVRKFDRAIYVLGADHHGDAMRIKAAARALGVDDSRIVVLLYQFVNLKRGGELVSMHKRTGDFVALGDLIAEVGADAVRFMLISQSANSTIDFDLDLVKKQSDENPVYYVQYAHARIASILKRAVELGATSEGGDVSLLTHQAELELIREMLRLPEIVEIAATKQEPHHLPHYAIELAGVFHSFYKQCRVVSSDPADAELTRARLKLVAAAKNTLARTLTLMGVSAPETMQVLMKDLALGCMGIFVGMFLGVILTLLTAPIWNASSVPSQTDPLLLPDHPDLSVTASSRYVNLQLQTAIRQGSLANQATFALAPPNLVRITTPIVVSLLGQPIQINATATMSITVRNGRVFLTVDQVEGNGINVPQELVPPLVESLRAQGESQLNLLIQRNLQGTGLRLTNIRITPDELIMDLGTG